MIGPGFDKKTAVSLQSESEKNMSKERKEMIKLKDEAYNFFSSH